MTVTTGIIVTSGRARATCGEELDRLIGYIRQMKKTPLVVVGSDGDGILQASRRLEEAELVFDPNHCDDLFSSVKAGLEAVDSPSWLFVLGEAHIPPATWPEFTHAALTRPEPTPILAPATSVMHPDTGLYPWLLPTATVRNLKTQPAATLWATILDRHLLRIETPQIGILKASGEC